MSAELLGARLLGEVKEESLLELLKDIRSTINPDLKGVLRVPQVDDLLERVRYDRPVTPSRRPGWHTADDVEDETLYSTEHSSRRPEPPPNRPPVIEITSTHSSFGKTSLLYLLAAKALLPPPHGSSSLVLYIDTDGRFSATRLHQTLLCLLSTNTSSENASILATAALQNLLLIQPTSTQSLLTTLHALPTTLLSQHPAPHPLGLIILDSATAFIHQDRLDADLARLSSPSASTTSTPIINPPSTTSRTTLLTAALLALHQQFSSTIVFTTTLPSNTTTITSRTPTRPDPTANPPLPPEEARGIPLWRAFATLTLSIRRVEVPRFAPGMGLEECLRDREKRNEAMGKGRFVVHALSGTVKTAAEGGDVREKQGGGAFEVVSDGEGVRIVS